jgi:tetratricopeptide (TPR) repeat protein
VYQARGERLERSVAVKVIAVPTASGAIPCGERIGARARSLAPRDANVFKALGEALHHAENYEEALWAVDQSNRITPNRDTYFLSAITLAALERFNDAFRSLEAASRLDSSLRDRSDYHQSSGAIRFYWGRREEVLVVNPSYFLSRPDQGARWIQSRDHVR